MSNNTFIIIEPCETASITIINKSFPNIPTALQYMMENTGKLDNGQRFFIIDYDSGQSKRYCARLAMQIEDM